MDRAVGKNEVLSRIGWSLFVAGIVLQPIGRFAVAGFAAEQMVYGLADEVIE